MLSNGVKFKASFFVLIFGLSPGSSFSYSAAKEGINLAPAAWTGAVYRAHTSCYSPGSLPSPVLHSFRLFLLSMASC